MATDTTPETYPVVTLHGVDWDSYCQIRDEEVNNHVRMNYLDGTLTIMSPEYLHDGHSRRFYEVVTTVAGVWEIDYMPIGTTTLRRKGRLPKKGSGKEPDEGFYLGADEARVRDNTEINLSVDPPPSLAFEVDNKAGLKEALEIDARLGVPELWLYKVARQGLRFVRLVEGAYVEIARSVVLPRLTPTLVLQALEARSSLGDRLWVRWLEDWARALPELSGSTGSDKNRPLSPTIL